MNWRYVQRITSLALASLAMLVITVTGGGSASAQEADDPAPKFSLALLDTEGTYFDLTLAQGETQQVQVEVRNTGTADGDAYLYLADVTTRVNGGMSVGLAGEPVNGPARWIDFSEETLPLAAGATFTQTLTISVPDDATPGEHLTSIVIQDAGDLADSDSDVMLRTVSRQALGILVTVPGPVTAALEIGAAGNTTVGDHSVVTFQATNSGNVRLRTTGEFTLADTDGQEVFSTPVEYSSIYAHTSATLEVPLDVLLEPGDYTASLQLEDNVHGLQTASGALALNVPVPEEPVVADPQAPEAVAESGSEQPVTSGNDGIPTWTLLVAIPAAVVLGALIAVVGLRRRSKPEIAVQQAAVARPVVASDTPARKPATVRRMMPPGRAGENRISPSASQDRTD